jgi:hypothetical protein
MGGGNEGDYNGEKRFVLLGKEFGKRIRKIGLYGDKGVV